MKFRALVSVLLLSLFLAPLARGAEDDGDEVVTPTPEASPSATPADDAPKKKKHEKADSEYPTVHVSGYLQTFFEEPIDANHDGAVEPDRFRVLRARVSFKGKIAEHVGYDLMIDPRSPQITGLMRDGFLTLDYVPHHVIRIGQQKTQFGYENDESSTKLYVVNRSEVSDGPARGFNLRDIGIGLIGFVPLGKGVRFEDAVTVVNGRGENPPGFEDNDRVKNVWGRVGLRLKGGGTVAHLGVSGAAGNQFDPGNDLLDGNVVTSSSDNFSFDIRRAGADLEVENSWVSLAAEFVYAEDKTTAAGNVSGETVGEKSISRGYYVTVAGKTCWNAGPIVRYDALDDFQRWTFGAYYGLPSQRARLIVNYELHLTDDAGERDDDKLYVMFQGRF